MQLKYNNYVAFSHNHGITVNNSGLDISCSESYIILFANLLERCRNIFLIIGLVFVYSHFMKCNPMHFFLYISAQNEYFYQTRSDGKCLKTRRSVK